MSFSSLRAALKPYCTTARLDLPFSPSLTVESPKQAVPCHCQIAVVGKNIKKAFKLFPQLLNVQMGEEKAEPYSKNTPNVQKISIIVAKSCDLKELLA